MLDENEISADALSASISRRSDTLLRIKEALIENLQLDYTPDEIDDDTILFGAGLELDSIDMVEIVIFMEASFGVSIPDDDLSSLRTVNTLADLALSAAP